MSENFITNPQDDPYATKCDITYNTKFKRNLLLSLLTKFTSENNSKHGSS